LPLSSEVIKDNNWIWYLFLSQLGNENGGCHFNSNWTNSDNFRNMNLYSIVSKLKKEQLKW
jgi:hypothetical protein